jgi:hypothetical protein
MLNDSDQAHLAVSGAVHSFVIWLFGIFEFCAIFAIFSLGQLQYIFCTFCAIDVQK